MSAMVTSVGEGPNGPTLEANPPVELWLQQPRPDLSWESFFDSELLRAWGAELGQSLPLRDLDHWRVTGPAVVVQSSDSDEAAEMLLGVSTDVGVGFARVPPEDVQKVVTNLPGYFQQYAPILVMLDHGPWVRGEGSPAGCSEETFVAQIRDALGRFDVSAPVLCAVCCPDTDALHPDLRRVGAFDRCFVIQEPDAEFVGRRFLADLGQDVADAALQAAPLKAGRVLLNMFQTRHERAAAALRLKRIARREWRKIEFNDLTELALRGLQESSAKGGLALQEVTRRKTAYHEAGHACIAVITSRGANVPDYASIVPSRDFYGVVLPSLAYGDTQDELTFHAFRMRVQVLLAGRAAEEMFFGLAEVSTGAQSDLTNATSFCFGMFGFAGFHPGMGRGEGSGLNLAVLGPVDRDPVQNDRVSCEVRAFLAEQYEEVLRTLAENRDFVEAVADRLMWDPVVDREEMAELARKQGLKVAGEYR